MDLTLHQDNFARMTLSGSRIRQSISRRAASIASLTENLTDPNISIVIRTRNSGKDIRRLFDDIQKQLYNGAVQTILVDTESHDDTAKLARSFGAEIVSIKQSDFSYPKALNIGFERARHDWVLTLVGHSCLSNRLLLKSITYWSQTPKLGGIYSLPLANWNASRWERFESTLAPNIWRKPKIIKKQSIGMMAANCSIVNKKIWQQLGGYNDNFAGGGEDTALARDMLDNDFTIVREPLCTVFHSHGLGTKDNFKQWIHWIQVAKRAQPFDTRAVHDRRPDLR